MQQLEANNQWNEFPDDVVVDLQAKTLHVLVVF